MAVPTPLRRLFDYLPAKTGPVPPPGGRVRVAFGRQRLVGVVVEHAGHSSVPAGKLRRILAVLDPEPILDPVLFRLIRWAAAYYHHPEGEAFAAALPVLLRQGREAELVETRFRLTAAGEGEDTEALARRAPRQAEILATLADAPEGLAASQLPGTREPLNRLVQAGLAEAFEAAPSSEPPVAEAPAPGPELNPAQRRAVGVLAQAEEAVGVPTLPTLPTLRFGAYLLDGVTGSGKTEVYIHAMERVLAAGRQCLVLVPEISLTPQLVRRFRRRLAAPMAVLHSGLTDAERLGAWRAARSGEARVVVGTRSAVFAPLAEPGLVIVDEEHDASLKQQDGFRYNARDLAVYRAQLMDVPVVLGSATPALESLENARRSRYTRLHLPERPGAAAPTRLRTVDLRLQRNEHGLSPILRESMHQHLEAGNQVLLFLNRRGFAPALFCGDCGWIASCDRCDARLTLHRRRHELRCHHCDRRMPEPERCPECRGELVPVGQGTQRVEDALGDYFPEVPMVRIDRDAARRRGRLPELLEQARTGEAKILVGTQMLAKGHHFPGVTLAAILDADQGLFGSDFRASERLAQLVVQVAGRAGRADRPGEVIIQTAWPEHPLLQTLLREGYAGFAEAALAEREQAAWPPFTSLAMLRAESPDAEMPMTFLKAAVAEAPKVQGVELLGPAPATMERRAGLYRAQLLISGERARLQRLLGPWLDRVEALPTARKVRWSLDVDPVDLH